MQKMRDEGMTAFDGERVREHGRPPAGQRPRLVPTFTHLQPNYLDEKFMQEQRVQHRRRHLRASAFPPFTLADQVPALADYLELMHGTTRTARRPCSA